MLHKVEEATEKAAAKLEQVMQRELTKESDEEEGR